MSFTAPAALQNRGNFLRLTIVAVCITLLLSWRHLSLRYQREGIVVDQEAASTHPPCWNFPGANETLVVLRTGSTEIQDRFSIHKSTSLRCFPHYLVFSDVEEEFASEHVLDALEGVSPETIALNPDFELYRRLQRGRRTVLAPEQLSGSDAKIASASGEAWNPGWKLDKWKFPPMLNRTLYERPDMKWYVFVEADTLILWSMLQKYLAEQDPTQLLSAGYIVMIGPDAFAHCGTGFVVSQPALRLVVEYYTAHQSEIGTMTNEHWAGDCILGIVFRRAGVPLTNVKPIFQCNNPGVVFYGRPDGSLVLEEPVSQPQIWCAPTVSYHHMSPADIKSLWDFEQEWLENNAPDPPILRYRDVFKHYVMPQMATPRRDWDNLSDDDLREDVRSIEECWKACEARADCNQYSYDEDHQCRTRANPRLGNARTGVSSGWIMHRVVSFEQNMEPCGDPQSWSLEPW